MGNSSCNSASRGIEPPVLLAIVFIVLKLCHVIDWSWWWVLAPLWGSLAFGLLLGLLLILFVLAVKKKANDKLIY